MRTGKFRLIKILFWRTMVKLIKKPAAAVDWLHQYSIAKLIIAMVQTKGG